MFVYLLFRWLAVRLEFMSAVVVTAAALFASMQRDNLNGAIVGLSVVYALRVSSIFTCIDFIFSEIDVNKLIGWLIGCFTVLL